jgi:O-antigen/teichoic acid export membrane protein
MEPKSVGDAFTALGTLLRGRRRLAGEAAWLASGEVFAGIGTLIAIRILTEAVPPSVFGEANLLMVFTGLAVALACNPFARAALRFYPEVIRTHGEKTLRASVYHFTVPAITALALLTAMGGAIYGWHAGLPMWIGLLLALVIVCDARKTEEMSFLNAARRQKLFAGWTALDTPFRPIFGAAAALLFGVSTQNVVLGYAAAAAALVVTFLILAKTPVRVGIASDPQLNSDLKRYALPLLPLAFVGWVSAASDRYIIGGILGLHEVGIYAATYGLVLKPFGMVNATLTSTLRPVYFESVAAGETPRAARILRSWLLMQAAIFGLGVIAVVLLRELIAGLLLAREYRESASLMPWLAIGFMFLCLSQTWNTVSLAYKASGGVTASEAVGALASVLLVVPLTWQYGLRGAAVAVPLYFAAQLVSSWHFAKRARARYYNEPPPSSAANA